MRYINFGNKLQELKSINMESVTIGGSHLDYSGRTVKTISEANLYINDIIVLEKVEEDKVQKVYDKLLADLFPRNIDTPSDIIIHLKSYIPEKYAKKRY